VHGFERSTPVSERMLADMQTLSGPSFNGRRPRSKDDLGSAYWVAEQFLASKISLALSLDRLTCGLAVAEALGYGTYRLHSIEAISTCRHCPETNAEISTARTPDNQPLGTGFSPGARFTICACPCSDRVRRLWDCRYRCGHG